MLHLIKPEKGCYRWAIGAIKFRMALTGYGLD